MSEDARRQDTRQKIELGGLIVKAGLRETDKAVLLGILLDAKSRLSSESDREKFKAIGKAAFRNDT